MLLVSISELIFEVQFTFIILQRACKHSVHFLFVFSTEDRKSYRFWKYIRVSKWWHNFLFWMNLLLHCQNLDMKTQKYVQFRIEWVMTEAPVRFLVRASVSDCVQTSYPQGERRTRLLVNHTGRSINAGAGQIL